MPTQDRIEQWLIALFLLTHAIAIPMALFYPHFFADRFAIEDGPVEYLTAVFLFLSAVTLIWRAGQMYRLSAAVQGTLLLVYALMYGFVAGEEISWGQRIFGWQSGSYFEAHNYQDETNLHNLVVGDTQLAENLFGNYLTIVLLLYLLVLPLVWRLSAPIRSLCRALAVPVPRPRHVVMALIASLTMLIIMGTERQFELYEYAFGLMSLMIFLKPWNEDAFAGQARRRQPAASGGLLRDATVHRH